MKPIFEYEDYRDFLADDFALRQAKNATYSLRSWARMLDVNPATLTRVLNKTRHISPLLALKFASCCHLSKKATEYFEMLVTYNQAKTLEERTYFYGKLLTYKSGAIRKVSSDQYEFYAKWYYTAIREVLQLQTFKGDYTALAGSLTPPIKVVDAKYAVELLVRLGLVAQLEDGTYKATEALITTGNSATAVVVDGFQAEMMTRARAALDAVPRPERNFSTLSLSVSEKHYETIIEELRAFRRKVLEMAKSNEAGGRVYQFNFHVFPLSKHIDQES